MDVSGVTFGGVLVEGFTSVFGSSAFVDGRLGRGAFGAIFRVAAGLASVERDAFDALVVLAVLAAAFVDFDLVAVFFALSGTLASTGSVMTFFGLPLFFSTSVDMSCGELVALKSLSNVVLKG